MGTIVERIKLFKDAYTAAWEMIVATGRPRPAGTSDKLAIFIRQAIGSGLTDPHQIATQAFEHWKNATVMK